MNTLLKLENISYWYNKGNERFTILDHVDMEFEKGKIYTIVGPSGSGKTTLLALASGLDKPLEGNVIYNGKNVKQIGLTNYRNRYVSIVFQAFNLLPYMTALQNVMSAMEIRKVKGNRKEIALQYLNKVGLTEAQANQKVLTLSGGQQQRVAVARALACDAEIIFADEPTGNLDVDTAAGIFELFQKLAKEENKCVIIVTHDVALSKLSDVNLKLHKGKLV
ncbi:MAG: ABC transporter ATP-binding protein [Bacillaceae bacterium]